MDCDLKLNAKVMELTESFFAAKDSKVASLIKEDAITRRIKVGRGRSTETSQELHFKLAKLQERYDKSLDEFGDFKINPANGEYIIPHSLKELDRQIKTVEDRIKVVNSYSKEQIARAEDYSVATIYSGRVDNKVDKSIDYDKYMGEIEDYTATAYMTDIPELRKGRDSSSGIEHFLKEAEQNFSGVVYRGSRLDANQLEHLNNLMVDGAILVNKAPMSTSTNGVVAKEFAKGDVVRGRKDAIFSMKTSGHDIGHMSSNATEDEVLLAPGKYYQVLDKTETDMQVHVLLEEIHPDIVAVMKENPMFADGLKSASDKILSAIGLGLGANAIQEEEL